MSFADALWAFVDGGLFIIYCVVTALAILTVRNAEKPIDAECEDSDQRIGLGLRRHSDVSDFSDDGDDFDEREMSASHEEYDVIRDKKMR